MIYKGYIKLTKNSIQKVIDIEADNIKDAKEKLTIKILNDYCHEYKIIKNVELHEINNIVNISIHEIL